MITIVNKLATSLVIPEGLGDKGALVLAPKAEAKVEKMTASIKDAEKQGVIEILYPSTRKKNNAKAEVKSETKAEQQETT